MGALGEAAGLALGHHSNLYVTSSARLGPVQPNVTPDPSNHPAAAVVLGVFLLRRDRNGSSEFQSARERATGTAAAAGSSRRRRPPPGTAWVPTPTPPRGRRRGRGRRRSRWPCAPASPTSRSRPSELTPPPLPPPSCAGSVAVPSRPSL